MIKKGDPVKVRLPSGRIVYAIYSHQSEGSKNHWVKYNGKFFESVGKTQALKFDTGNLLGRCRFIYDSNLIENRFKKMKKITIKHRETGEQVEAFIDAESTIYLANGRVADFNVWSYDEKPNIVGGVSLFVMAAFVVYAMASAIVYFTASDERKFMRDCLQTAKEQECISQWFVMQRDK